MKKGNGFTLIELLAVIVILAVILVISIPRILNVIETSKLDSIKSSARMIINSAEKKNMIDKVNGSTTWTGYVTLPYVTAGLCE